jgi:hypothetical protein
MTMGTSNGYQVADYLLQHIEPERYTSCPPATFWDACIDHITDPSVLDSLGHCAADRMRYRYAIPLFHRFINRPGALADRRNWHTAHRLSGLLIDQGSLDEGSAILRDLSRNDEPLAGYQLAKIKAKNDEIRADMQSDTPSPESLTRLMAGLRGSRTLRQLLAASGEPPAAQEARLTETFGRLDDLRRRFNSDNTDINAGYRLVDLLATRGDFDEALPILYVLVDGGVPDADTRLIATLAEMGRPREFLRGGRTCNSRGSAKIWW